MKKFVIAVIATLVVIIALFLSYVFTRHTNTPHEQTPDSASLASSYLLKEYDGRIAIYKTGDQEPMDIIDVPFESLPPADQQALQEGVVAQSDEHLNQLIEDYGS